VKSEFLSGESEVLEFEWSDDWEGWAAPPAGRPREVVEFVKGGANA